MADPKSGFDDLSFVENYEQVSSIMILANKGPIII